MNEYGATPAMRQRLNDLQRGYYGTPYMPPQMNGRIVTSIEEAKAAQIPFDGSSTFFPSPAEGRVYEKFLGLDGLPVFRVYAIMKAEESKRPLYAEAATVAELKARLDALEKQIGGERNGSVSVDSDAAG